MRKGSAIIVAGAILIGGCGGGDDDSKPSETETPTAEVLGQSIESPTMVVVTEAPEPQTTTTYTVAEGDTLGAIAQRFGVTVDAIAEASGITDVALIHIGQELRIPSASSSDTGTADAGGASTDG